MFKRQKRMIFIMGLLFIIYLSSCKKVDTDIMESITLEDGQTYIYMEYPNGFTYEIKGVDIEIPATTFEYFQ